MLCETKAHRLSPHRLCGIIQGNQQLLNPLKIVDLKPLLKYKYGRILSLFV